MRIGTWFLIAICFPANLAATTCIEASQRQAFRHAFAVFRGTVVQVQNMDAGERSEPMLVTFKVDRGWKGPVAETMRVFVFGSPPLGDGYHFREGQRYIVYATNDVPQDWDLLRKFRGGSVVYGIGSMCPWRVRADVDEESRKLGKGRPPKPDLAKRQTVGTRLGKPISVGTRKKLGPSRRSGWRSLTAPRASIS